jgi:hypothetical protein
VEPGSRAWATLGTVGFSVGSASQLATGSDFPGLTEAMAVSESGRLCGDSSDT